MTPVLTRPARPLDGPALRHSALIAGPTITLVIPGGTLQSFGPGSQLLVRSLVNEVTERAAAQRLVEAIPMVRRLDEMAKNWPSGPAPRLTQVVFASTEGLAHFETDGEATAYAGPPIAKMGSYPLLRPFIRAANLPTQVVVLFASRKMLRLFDYHSGICRERDLPIGIPPSFDELEPDENRRHLQLEPFFALVDHALKPAIAGLPLVIAGSEEDVAAYRRGARFSNLVPETAVGNWDHASTEELSTAVTVALERQAEAEALQAVSALRERADVAAVITDAQEAHLYASDGRINQLFFESSFQAFGKLPPSLDRARLRSEDLVNAAVVETLRHGGDVMATLGEPLPGHQLVAELRY